MKEKFFVIALGLFLVACNNENADINKETKEDVQSQIKSNTLEDNIYQVLADRSLRSDFSDKSYTRIDFDENGQFAGDFLGNYKLDGKDFGQNSIANENYGKDEVHKSIFSGIFSLDDTIKKGIYKIKLNTFTLNNKIGVDDKMDYLYWVDFATGLSKEDDYILFLPGTVIDEDIINNSQYKGKLEDLLKDSHEDFKEDHKNSEQQEANNEESKEDYHKQKILANGVVLYNKTQGLIFSEHDKWAMTEDEH